MMENNEAFAWDNSERGRFKSEYFPLVDIPIKLHTPWLLKNILMPPGVLVQRQVIPGDNYGSGCAGRHLG